MTLKSLLRLPETMFSEVLNKVSAPLERKRVVIAINMSFAQITIYLSLFIYASLKGYNSETTYYALIAAGMILLLLLLTFYGKYKFAMGCGLFITCISTIFIAQRVGARSGVDHYYVVLGVVPFVFYGYKDRNLAIAMTTLAFICFMISRTIALPFIEPMVLTSEQSQIFLIINSMLVFLLTTYSLVRILEISHAAEREMLHKQILTEAQNAELTRVNQELDKFVYSASHDLSAPLKSVLGLIEISKMESPSPNVMQYLSLMKQSVVKLETFIYDIINYSRNSRLAIKHEVVDIPSLVKSIWEDHLFYTNQKSRIELLVENHLESTFYSDETRMRIIFNNLFSNSIKFHLEDDREKPFVKVIAKEEERHFYFEVTDNGRGINSQLKDSIFEMFFRANDSVNGSGLGLYILKESVDKLNGTVQVESKEGEGTSFIMRFPKN